MTDAPPDLHPDLQPLAMLLGTWAGAGTGSYPTIESFDYLESVTFTHVGKAFLAYGQRTRATSDGRPLHAETGYVRVPEPGRIEFVLAHPTGVTELAEGSFESVDGKLVIRVASTVIGLSGSAKSVTAVERDVVVTGDELRYDVRMAAVGHPLTHHLTATLRQAGSGAR